ncbi:unnamed protein product [Brassica oleracea]|uniref:Clp R domain-containing protein n=1 Tax=Brassica oleracea TaxID=3712 RepID=A0A3P6FL30_BRAOL|nr:unnamed protein product [Brassica oleracea]
MASCDTTIGPLLHRQARCLTSASTVFSVPTHRDVYLGAVPVPETFRGRVLHGDSTGTAWGRLENIAMSTTAAAKLLRGNGVTLFKVRDETINLLGKSDMYFFSPEHPPLTEPAGKAIDWAVDEKKKSGVA